MSIKTALAKLRRRQLNFRTLRAALEHHGLPTSTGWTKLEQKFEELSIPVADAVAYANKLERIYFDNLEWGDKAVQIVQLDTVAKTALAPVVAHLFAPEFVPSAAPLDPMTDADLNELTLHPKLVRAISNETRTGITLYFCSRAYQVEKETFTVEDMKDEVSVKRFSGYDHVIAYKQLVFQRTDTVFVDSRSGRIEFRVDTTRLTTVDKMLDALVELKGKFRALLVAQLGDEWATIEFPLTNFFPKIHEMYLDSNGTVVELAHNTPAGAINHGKMRGLKGNLKSDPSHLASMEASDNEKFAIQKAYEYFGGISIAYLSIPGKSAALGFADPVINTALIGDCIVSDQFHDLMQILR